MQLDDVNPGSPQDWLYSAASDMILAEIDPPKGVRLESFCFHAQQAAEKSLKALLLFLDISFPRTHDIRALFALLPDSVLVPESFNRAYILTDYSVTGRYPGYYEPVTQENYREALILAKEIHKWVKSIVLHRQDVGAIGHQF